MATQTVDILILHGKSLGLVSDLKNFFESLEISAGTVLDQPSEKQPQRTRVLQRIDECKLALVLATYDEDAPTSRSPRANVVNELTICLDRKPENTLVLQEVRENIPVDIGSNLHGHLVIIPFAIAEFHKLYPTLLKELRSRLLFSSSNKNSEPKSLTAARYLNDFLDKMDDLWASFDKASFKILRHDYKTQKNFSDNLDKLFICYWKVFHELVRKKGADDLIRIVADEQYRESQKYLEKVWQEVTDALMEHASKLRTTSKIKSLPSLLTSFQKADSSLKEVRKVDKIESRIKTYSDAAETLDIFIKKVETGR